MKLPVIILLATLYPTVVTGQNITNYEPFTGLGKCSGSSEEVVVLRKFHENNQSWYVIVSPVSLETKVLKSDSLIIEPANWERIRKKFLSSPYVKALEEASLNGDALQNAGFTRLGREQKGLVLTVDLCPSHHQLDRVVFNTLIAATNISRRPVPAGVSVSGRWIREHPADLRWLDSLTRTGELSIVWINHSYNHNTFDDVPLKNNFLLAAGTNIRSEVLNTEALLLENNIVPSVFFRFPGLVSNREIYDKVLEFGLIPIGSDAWLAKGQKPSQGSIVLVHGNGNEPSGVDDLVYLLNNKRSVMYLNQWGLFDLKKSLIDYLLKK
jgi:hypothetical protein